MVFFDVKGKSRARSISGLHLPGPRRGKQGHRCVARIVIYVVVPGYMGPGYIIVAITMARNAILVLYRVRFRIMCHK